MKGKILFSQQQQEKKIYMNNMRRRMKMKNSEENVQLFHNSPITGTIRLPNKSEIYIFFL